MILHRRGNFARLTYWGLFEEVGDTPTFLSKSERYSKTSGSFLFLVLRTRCRLIPRHLLAYHCAGVLRDCTSIAWSMDGARCTVPPPIALIRHIKRSPRSSLALVCGLWWGSGKRLLAGGTAARPGPAEREEQVQPRVSHSRVRGCCETQHSVCTEQHTSLSRKNAATNASLPHIRQLGAFRTALECAQ